MIKILFLFLFITILQAKSFRVFLQYAIQNSPYLKANQLNIEKTNMDSQIITRYKNPILEAEASKFDRSINNSANGYRVNITQPIRLWNVYKNQKSLADIKKITVKSLVLLKKAQFIRDISWLYINFKQMSQEVKLAITAVAISQTIVNISKQRFKSGTIAKIRYLQALVELQKTHNRLNKIEMLKQSKYYSLLEFAGIKHNINLQNDYKFIISSLNISHNFAQIKYLKNRVKIQNANAVINSNKVKWINIYGEFEKQPSKNIIRVGINIPLTIFNTKSQEKQISLILARQKKFLVKQKENATNIALKRLNIELSSLQKLKKSTQILLIAQKRILQMYQDGYKIANIHLLELQSQKNEMLKTKQQTIWIDTTLSKDIVQHNYLVGQYNKN